MNRLFSIALAAILAMLNFTAYAQTGLTIQEAAELADGSNSVAFNIGEDYTCPRFFKYTSQVRGLLRVEGENTTVSINCVTEDSIEASCIKTGTSCIIPMVEGTTVYVQISPNMTLEDDITVNFFAGFEANANAGRGTSKSDPIVIEEKQTNITIDNVAGFEEFENFFTYQATETGALQLSCSGYVLTGKYGSSFNNLTNSFTTSYDNGKYVGVIPVQKGTTVCISIGAYTAMSVTATMTYPEKGTSSNYPIELIEGNNNVSAEFGEYWYLYDGAKEDGYLTISSEYTIPRGYVKVFTNDNLYFPVAQSETGYYDLRFKVRKNTSYLIYILKTEESDDWPNPDVINVSFDPLQKGESASNPIILTPNQAEELSNTSGTYYYSISVPQNSENQMIEFDIIGESKESYFLTLYNAQKGSYYAVTGYGECKVEAESGHSYMLVVEKNKAGEGTLMPYVRDMIEGESIFKPITLQIGENPISKANDVYLQYKATINGRISLAFNIPSVVIDFPISTDPEKGVYVAYPEGGTTKLDVVEGTNYFIHLTNVSEDCILTFTEEGYKSGDTKEMAIEVTDSKVTLTPQMMNTWFRYTAAKDGKMVISSNITDDGTTSIYYSIGDDTYMSYIINNDEEGNIIYRTTFSINKGETIYVHLVSSVEHGGKDIVFDLRDFAQGESLHTAFELIPNGNSVNVPLATRKQNQWVRIPVNGAKKITVTTDRFISGGIFLNEDVNRAYDIEFTPDGNNEVQTAVYESNEPVEYLYVKVAFSNGKIVMSASADYTSSITNTELNTLPIETYSINGVRLSSPQRGINIIRRADGSVKKVIR